MYSVYCFWFRALPGLFNYNYKCKGHPITFLYKYRRVAQFQHIAPLALEVGEWSAPRFGEFTTGKEAVTII